MQVVTPVQKNVLLGPAQAGLGWPYLVQAGLAQHGLGRPGPAKAGKLQFSLAIHWPGPAQASHGLA